MSGFSSPSWQWVCAPNGPLLGYSRVSDESELRAATGLRGRPRKIASDEERARVNARNLVCLAIRKINQHDPALAIFLTNSFKTGLRCSYIPDKAITWVVSL